MKGIYNINRKKKNEIVSAEIYFTKLDAAFTDVDIVVGLKIWYS